MVDLASFFLSSYAMLTDNMARHFLQIFGLSVLSLCCWISGSAVVSAQTTSTQRDFPLAVYQAVVLVQCDQRQG